MFLFENVKGLLSMKDENGNSIIEDIRNKFEHIDDNLGYRIVYDTLDAVRYGIPPT